MRNKMLTTTLAGMAIALAATASAQRDERFTRRLDVGENGELSVTNVSGDIQVEATSGSEIIVDAVKTLEGRGESSRFDDVVIDVTQTGDRVRIETRYQGRHGHGRNGGVSVSYRIQVPRGTEVDLHSVSGNVTVSGVEGEVSLQSVSGDVSAADVANLAEAKSVSGEVRVRRARSPRDVEISSVSGDVVVESVEAEELTVSAVSGDVALDGAACERATLESVSGDLRYTGRITGGGRYEFKSHSGDVVITIGEDVGFQLEASTFSGDIESEMPLTATSLGRRGRSLSGVVGDGRAIIEVTTFSGDVDIRRR